MKIILPPKIGEQSKEIDTTSLVVVGANGSGKSRFGTNIEFRYLNTAHRISAQKSLMMPEMVSPTSLDRAKADLFFGNSKDKKNKSIYRWEQKPNIFLLDDYKQLMVLLHTEEYHDSVTFKENYQPGQTDLRPITKLDKIQRIWQLVLPHRKLKISAGLIEAYPTSFLSKKYNASEMSDGERVIFYLIGEIVSVPTNSIVIIDEPEMHLHKAVTKLLWDEIEIERPDCTFIYLTHDVDFAVSRQNSEKIWMKSYSDNVWDYEILSESSLPELLNLDILGSRQPVLFIEGESTSIDYKLLPCVFPNFNVKPLGSSSKVINATKSFNDQTDFHHIHSFGLIDRDRRTEEEIDHISEPNIWVSEVAEIENFLLLEQVIKTVAINMMKENENDVFNDVKTNVINFFKSEIIPQALGHTISRIDRIFRTATTHKGISDYSVFESLMKEFWDNQDFRKIYDNLVSEFTQLSVESNYDGILKIFNNKGIIAKSNVAALCGIHVKENSYLNYVISILKLKNEKSEAIREAIKSKIKITSTI